LPRGKQVGDHRHRRRRAARLTHPDADAGDQQLDEGARQAADRSHAAPQGQADDDQIAPVQPIRRGAQRQAGQGIEDGE
jgi:hypothetical protein